MNKELLQQIKTNIKNDGRTPVSWARLRGFTPGLVTALLTGFYNPRTPKAQEIIERLRQDGYMPPELDQAA